MLTAPLLTPCRVLVLLRYLLGTSALFVLGLLIGWFTHGSPVAKAPAAPSDSSDLLEELLRRITADKIDALQRWVPHIHDQNKYFPFVAMRQQLLTIRVHFKAEKPAKVPQLSQFYKTV